MAAKCKKQTAASAGIGTEAKRRAALIDELGKINDHFDALDEMERRRKVLNAEIAGWSVRLPAEEAHSYEGTLYAAIVSGCASVRTIDKALAFKAMGQALFIDACKISIKSVDENCSKAAALEIVSAPQAIGARSVTTSRRGKIIEVPKAA